MMQPKDFFGPATKLRHDDYTAAAEKLGCQLAAIRAVAKVEAQGRGFLIDGRPKILFESHQFHRITRGRFDESNPALSTKKWERNYGSSTKEYKRLESAMALDHDAALKSASWGMFQIMGFNYSACGHVTVDRFVRSMCTGERAQLNAFCLFIQTNRFVGYIRDCDWAGFAKKYNGPGYKKNKYDSKMAAAFAEFSAKDSVA